MTVRVPEKLATRRAEIAKLCERLGVRRLELFGSAATGASPRDFDFLVDLGERSPEEYADAYFNLREALEALFSRPVDLVTAPSVRNPFFRQRLEQTRSMLYAA